MLESVQTDAAEEPAELRPGTKEQDILHRVECPEPQPASGGGRGWPGADH